MSEKSRGRESPRVIHYDEVGHLGSLANEPTRPAVRNDRPDLQIETLPEPTAMTEDWQVNRVYELSKQGRTEYGAFGSAAYTHNALHQVLSHSGSGPAAYTWNVNGNIETRTGAELAAGSNYALHFEGPRDTTGNALQPEDRMLNVADPESFEVIADTSRRYRGAHSKASLELISNILTFILGNVLARSKGTSAWVDATGVAISACMETSPLAIEDAKGKLEDSFSEQYKIGITVERWDHWPDNMPDKPLPSIPWAWY